MSPAGALLVPCSALLGGGTAEQNEGRAERPSEIPAEQAERGAASGLANKVLERTRRAAAGRNAGETEPEKTCSADSEKTAHAEHPGTPRPGLATILTAELVRCANCREVRYLATPPSRNGGARRERLVCRRGLDVTPRELVTPSRYCTLFNRRPPSRQEGHR